MTDREIKIMDATMEIVSEVGLEGFSMRQLCARADLKAPLIYAVFESKEDLLYRCFLYVNRQIAELFKGVSLSPEATEEEIMEYFHGAWVRYFRFMVENGSRSIYYYIYRDSAGLQKILMRNNATVAQDMEDYRRVFQVISQKLNLFRELSPDLFYVFLLDGTGNFVRRAIRMQRTISEQEVESIWRLLTRGILDYTN